MVKTRTVYVLKSKKGQWKRLSLIMIYFLFTFTVIYFVFKQSSLLLATLFVFGFYLFYNFSLLPEKEKIEVYFDRLVYKNNKLEKTLQFNEIAFIDQDVVETEKTSYYNSIEFLNDSMESLLYIDAQGFKYDELVFLCNRIQYVNQVFTSEKKTLRELVTFDTPDIT